MTGLGLPLRDRSVLITGASAGIGAAAADALAAVGARVVLVGRDRGRLDEVAARTGGEGVVADLTTAAGLRRAGDLAAEADILVNNAGQGWAGDLPDMPADVLSRLVTLNLAAPMQLTRSALPGMRRRGSGHLVFVSSIAAVGVAHEAVYAATKAGLRAFAASLRHEVQGDGLGVSTVFPAVVDTSFFEGRGRPYDRRWPEPVSAQRVAAAIVGAIEHGRPEVFVPAWSSVAVRVHGALPGVFHRLAGRFG